MKTCGKKLNQLSTGRCPNKNSFERSLKRFQTSEKGFGQQPTNFLPPLPVEMKYVTYKSNPYNLSSLYKSRP